MVRICMLGAGPCVARAMPNFDKQRACICSNGDYIVVVGGGVAHKASIPNANKNNLDNHSDGA